MEACRVLDGLRSFNTHYSGVLHIGVNPKKFLNSTRAILHHMMHFFCLDGQSGFKHLSSVGNLFQLDGVKSSMTTCDVRGLPKYLCIDPSTIQIVRRIHGHEYDHVQVIEIKIEGCKYALKIFKNCEGQEQDPSFRVELDFLVKLNHPHIVQLIAYCIDHFRTSILLEWLPNDPQKLIEYQKETQKTRQPLSQFEAKALITRIAKGLALCIVNICSIGI